MTPDKTPSPEELEALARKHGATSYRNRADTQHPAYGFTEDGLRNLLADVLAKWGSPVVAVEPVAWRLKDEEASRHYGKEIYVYYGKEDFQEGVDPCDFIAGIEALTTPTPTRAQAGAVPLTCEWAHNENDGFWESACGEAWRFDDGGPAENSMHFCHSCGKSLRIKGGQHGTE